MDRAAAIVGTFAGLAFALAVALVTLLAYVVTGAWQWTRRRITPSTPSQYDCNCAEGDVR